MFTTTSILTPSYNAGRFGNDVDIIGIHTMEAPESSQTAENVAKYFQKIKASAHWCVDNNSRVRSVEDRNTAWTLPGANSRSLNLEFAGYARQTVSEWTDEYSIDMLEIGAYCAAEWVIKYGIPVRRLTDSQIANGDKGFAGHVDVNRVYKKSSHWDPGPSFPWAYFLDRVRFNVAVIQNGNQPLTPTPQEDIMASLQELKDVVRTELAQQLAGQNQFAFRLVGSKAAYLDLGTARRHLTGAQNAGYSADVRDLPAGDPFWVLPLVGMPGELYRMTGDTTGAAFVLDLGALRHITAEEHALMGSPMITDLSADNALWSRPIAV